MGLIQLDTQSDKCSNMKQICEFIDEAAAKGAKLVAFPEVMNYMGKNTKEGGGTELIPGGYTTKILMKKAKEHDIYIHCGSFYERTPGERKKYNTSVMLNNKGEIIAKYRKLHLFDAILQDGQIINESIRIEPGVDIVNVNTEIGNLGFTICYDIRFPELFRLLVLNGAQIIFTPANFTVPTGMDHWETILRTRAIENGCYIIAPAQVGKKYYGHSSFGNSMVVDPWGNVIAKAKDQPCVTMVEIDLDYLDKIRQMMPSLKNRRADVYDLKIKKE